jgi:hypothetical protein
MFRNEADMRQEKLDLLQTSMNHIASLWEADGHAKWEWVMPSFASLEKEFDDLSLQELRHRLRSIYRRLAKEQRSERQTQSA